MIVHAYSSDVRVEREADVLVKNGYTVDMLCLRAPGESETALRNGINVYRLPVRRYRKGMLVQLFEYLAFFCLVFFRLARPSARYNVVHVHNLPDFLIFAGLISRLRGARLVLDIHDLMPEFYLSRLNNRFYSRWFGWLIQLQEKLSCRFAHHVITVSEPWRQTLIKRSVPDQKSSVLMNVPGDLFLQNIPSNKVAEPERKEFQLFYHGSVVHRYGLDLALQAVAQVVDEIAELRFTIHGNDDYLETLIPLAKELGLTNIVTFSTEELPIEELPGFIAEADVGIVPYRSDVFTDGILPTKLMEYVALGIPTIVSRTSAVEVYFDDTMVEFFSPGNVAEMADCIRRLYHDQTRCQKLAHNARRFNQLYSWSNQADHLLELANRLSFD